MSDEEIAGPMGGAGALSDDEMPDAGVGNSPSNPMDAPTLPEGIQKEVVKEVSPAEWKRPKAGDEVTVHYVGTLQSDGSEFDSSRSRGKPFTFTLGKGQVIKGWDLGVATMRRGEVANFTLAPEFAYGEAGSPPKIPPNATLVFEVELLRWLSKDDLFGDRGVIKTELRPGTGWRKPAEGSEVRLSLRVLASACEGGDVPMVAADPTGSQTLGGGATASAATVLEERLGMDYTLGSGMLGPLSRAVDKALTQMKKEEQVRLVCSRDYAYGEERPEGVVLELTLEQLYEVTDVSFMKDRSLLKKVLADGVGWETPADGSKVTLSVEAASDSNGTPVPGFSPATLEFGVGDGEVCDALECAAGEMKYGERALLTCTAAALCADERLGLAKDAAGPVVLTLEMVDYAKGKDMWSMSEEEKVAFASGRKEVGANLFRQGRYHLALTCYTKVTELFSDTDSWKEQGHRSSAKQLKKLCELNVAACRLRLGDFMEAKDACDRVLKEDPANVKALFRRAQADFALRNFEDCSRDLRRVVEAEPQNREARKLLREALAGRKEDDAKVKGLFAKMCQGLGQATEKAHVTPADKPADEPAGAGEAEVQDVEMAAEDGRATVESQAEAQPGVQGPVGAATEGGPVAAAA